MVEGQIFRDVRAPAIKTTETVPQEDVKPRESGIAADGNVFFQGNDTGKPEPASGRVNEEVVFGKNADPVQNDGLDDVLP